MEWKISSFRGKKWKWRGDMKVEMEIFKTKVEIDFFIWKRKWKFSKRKWKWNFLCGNGNKNETCFPVEQTWKRNFPFPWIWNFCFYYRPIAALLPNYQTTHNDTMSRMSMMDHLRTNFYYHTHPIWNSHVLLQYYLMLLT